MTQETWNRFNTDSCKMESVTVIETECPCCRQFIRFIDPNHLGLHSFEKEAEHWKEVCEHAYKEIERLKRQVDFLVSERK